MTTTIHQMHMNSLTAYFALDLDARSKLILTVYDNNPDGSFTDREICYLLGFSDLNCVRPRISGLIDKGVLIEFGHVKCPTTHKRVRLIKLARTEKQEELF